MKPETPAGRILLADDEELLLAFLSERLRREGYACDCAADGAEAVRFLATQTYDLLVSDINMPGNEDLDLIRSVPRLNAGLPVILMTGNPNMPTAIQSIGLPVIAYLIKPLDFTVLLREVQRGVSFRKVATTLASFSDRLQGWVDDMGQVRREFEASPQATSQAAMFGALALTIGNTAGALLDLQELFKLAVSVDPRRPDLCEVVNCPRLEALERAVADGIDVLERTKDSYRSKELGALRKRYEMLISVRND